MKRIDDPRHVKRKKLVNDLFSASFRQNKSDNVTEDIRPILSVLPQIDKTIESSAPQFPVDKIAKVDAAILRVAIYELLFAKKEPPKVIVDEAVELAKEFGGETSSSFVNGVLGNLLKDGIKKNKICIIN